MGREKIEIPEDELRELYRKLSAGKIAKIFNCDAATILNRMRAFGIERRCLSDAAKLDRGVHIPEDELRELYENQGLSRRELSKIFGCSEGTVKKRLQEYGIKVRGLSEAMALVNMSEVASIYPKSDFSGDLVEKAYLIGFWLGDLYTRRWSENSQTIVISCSSTKVEQIELIEALFQQYGHINIIGPDKRGVISITCLVNMSFDFLLPPKRDRIEKWITKDDTCFTAFLAGYVDAEGHIGVYNKKARIRLCSCDRNILHQIQAWMLSQGIGVPKPYLTKRKGDPRPYGGVVKKDYWCIISLRKDSLLRLFDLLDPYLKHPKRRRDMQAARANIEERNARKPVRQVEVDEAKLRYLHDERNLSQAEIAAILGCGRTTVFRRLQEHGIKTRSVSEAAALRQAKRQRSKPA